MWVAEGTRGSGMAEGAPGRDDAALTAALAGSGAAVALIHGHDQLVEYANEACQELFGWEPGARLSRIVPPGDTLRLAIERVLRTGEPGRVLEVPAGGGQTASVVCSPAPGGATELGGATEPGVLLVAVDTTDQVQARRFAEDRNGRLAMLDQATAAVTADLDPRRELIALARSVVPSLADACAIYLIDQGPKGGGGPDQVRATRLVCVIDPPTGVSPPPPEIRLPVAATRPIARAVASRQPVLLQPDDGYQDARGERWLRALAPHSLVAVPLGDPAVVAVITFVGTGDRRPYQAAEVALMQEITARAGTAFGHAMQLQHAREVAFALQRGLLSDPAETDWLQIAVRYRPAVAGLQVGGDWYDTVELPGGGIGLAVGDVVGHGLDAVSTMIQLRSMVQALACQPGAEPAAVLSALNRLSSHLGVGQLATVVYGRLTRTGSPAGAELTWASAGHPPPVLISATGTPTVLTHTKSPLLSLADHRYRQATLPVSPGSVLLFYTDGLIENPERPSADPIAELAASACRSAGGSLANLCDQLIAGAPATDDIALLAVRVRG